MIVAPTFTVTAFPILIIGVLLETPRYKVMWWATWILKLNITFSSAYLDVRAQFHNLKHTVTGGWAWFCFASRCLYGWFCWSTYTALTVKHIECYSVSSRLFPNTSIMEPGATFVTVNLNEKQNTKVNINLMSFWLWIITKFKYWFLYCFLFIF